MNNDTEIKIILDTSALLNFCKYIQDNSISGEKLLEDMKALEKIKKQKQIKYYFCATLKNEFPAYREAMQKFFNSEIEKDLRIPTSIHDGYYKYGGQLKYGGNFGGTLNSLRGDIKSGFERIKNSETNTKKELVKFRQKALNDIEMLETAIENGIHHWVTVDYKQINRVRAIASREPENDIYQRVAKIAIRPVELLNKS